VLERLREIGVDYAQGYFLHQPEPVDVVLTQAISQWSQTRP
jgi:EAL domain-containing protein (putative c-di-GMP-specific phosphodiesterase class I)